MQEKQKVTLYLPPELHRELKIKAAVETEPMSVIAERALAFYLQHPAVVDEVESSVHGAVHQVYSCPACASSVVLRDHELMALKQSSSLLSDDGLQVMPSEVLVPAQV
jgi:hypothetical protein